MNYLVTANNSGLGHTLSDEEVEVSPSAGKPGYFYASHGLLGCSKDYSSPADAVSALLQDNGYVIVSASPITLAYSDDMSLEDGLLLMKQYDDQLEKEGKVVIRVDYDPAYWRETYNIQTGKEFWDYIEGSR